MSRPEPPRSIKPRWGRIAVVLVLAGTATVLFALVGPCGGDDSDATATAGESWAARANAYCADGIQETSALTRPASEREAVADAAARIQIVATVRDGIYTLGEPADLDPTVAAVYVDALNEDLQGLDRIRTAVKSGDDYETLSGAFDEASGEPATQLGLDDCVAFADTVAGTS